MCPVQYLSIGVSLNYVCCNIVWIRWICGLLSQVHAERSANGRISAVTRLIKVELTSHTHLEGLFLAAFSNVIREICFGMFAAIGTPFVLDANEAKSENRLSTAKVDTE